MNHDTSIGVLGDDDGAKTGSRSGSLKETNGSTNSRINSRTGSTPRAGASSNSFKTKSFKSQNTGNKSLPKTRDHSVERILTKSDQPGKSSTRSLGAAA